MKRNSPKTSPGVYWNRDQSPQPYNQRPRSGYYCSQQWQIPPATNFFDASTEAHGPLGGSLASKTTPLKKKQQATAKSTSQLSHLPKRPRSPEKSDPTKRLKLTEPTQLCAPLQMSSLSKPSELVLPLRLELKSTKALGLTELPGPSESADLPKSLKPAKMPKMLTSAVKNLKLAESPNTSQSSELTTPQQPPMMPFTSLQTTVSPETHPVEVVLTPAVKAYIREVVREMIPQNPTGTADTISPVDVNRQISRRGGRRNRDYNGGTVHRNYHKKNQFSVYHMYFG